MKKLYIVRHGVAVPQGTPGIADDDRPLTNRGERQVQEIARGFRRLRIKLDAIVTSPLPRAVRTAEIMAEELNFLPRLIKDEILSVYHEVHEIRNWLDTRTEQSLMIVGHNPSCSDLVNVLLGAGSQRLNIEIRKGGIAAFWSEDERTFYLDWLARPKIIRR